MQEHKEFAVNPKISEYLENSLNANKIFILGINYNIVNQRLSFFLALY